MITSFHYGFYRETIISEKMLWQKETTKKDNACFPIKTGLATQGL